ncbi:MAG: serine--tRNA ligase [Candidatus Aenigmarchaeota archaeon]|nr:serine--tRNA ligase [Candidatus Aenigmarchaeota archaeon]
MLDIRLVRENPKIIEADLKKRFQEDKLKLLKELIDKDKERRELIQQVESLKHQRNILTKAIAGLKAGKKPAAKKLAEVKKVPEKIRSLDEKLAKLNDECSNALMRLPNLLHDSVPAGKSEDDNREISKYGDTPDFSFEPKDHIDLAVALNCIDVERAAKISGARFYFLKNQLALLDMALMRCAVDFLVKRNFSFSIPPYLMRRKPYEGVVDLNDFEGVLYKIEGEDLYLIATSEHPLTAQHMDETLSKLPIKYAGLSTNFRKEAGAHGKDTKGIFRVHQFNKVEQIVICRPEESWSFHEQLIKNAEEFLQSLELPFRKMLMCSVETGSVASKKYDLEAWMPAQKRFREVVSCSNCTDYQARRLNIKYREKDGEAPKGFVHTLNSTLVTDRVLVAILENNQQRDGSITIPKALQPYCGFAEIKKTNL